MNLSKTAQYAIRVISYMAIKKQNLYSASELIKKLKISDKYLKRILTTLSNSGILRSTQGRYGGFGLAKKPEDITLYEIVASIDNIEKYFGCILGFDECSDENPCSVHQQWAPIRNQIIDFLHNTTMSNVLDNSQILKF
jgi:Rrf2 family protein